MKSGKRADKLLFPNTFLIYMKKAQVSRAVLASALIVVILIILVVIWLGVIQKGSLDVAEGFRNTLNQWFK